MKQTLLKIGFNAIMMVIFVFIVWIMTRESKSDTTYEITVKLDKKPVVNNYHISQPTIVKERTIVYDSTRILTRQDSSEIVTDYLKERIYSDSVYNDTSKVKYVATVAKNSLTDIKIRHEYKPKIIEIKETKYRNALLVGLAPGWMPTLGFLAGFETKNLTYGVMYDPIRNPKGVYLLIQKRIYFKR